jgi:hypothetical protein
MKGRDNFGGVGIDDNISIKIDLNELEYEDVDWIQVAHDRVPVEGICEHDNELSCSKKGE